MTEQTAELQQQVAAQRRSGAYQHDPAAFRYIESLLERAHGQNRSVATLLEDKAGLALAKYTEAYEKALQQSRATLKQIEATSPDSGAAAAKMHEQSQFKQLEKLAARLAQDDGSEATLSALIGVLNQQAASHGDDPDSTPLEELMRHQEAEVVSSMGGHTAPAAQSKRGELKSARRFRNAQVKLNADKLVTLAIEEIPEGAGPLNSQRLAARSLAAMRDLSPYYLSRFVTYMDTLFWLEQAEKRKPR